MSLCVCGGGTHGIICHRVICHKPHAAATGSIWCAGAHEIIARETDSSTYGDWFESLPVLSCIQYFSLLETVSILPAMRCFSSPLCSKDNPFPLHGAESNASCTRKTLRSRSAFTSELLGERIHILQLSTAAFLNLQVPLMGATTKTVATF